MAGWFPGGDEDHRRYKEAALYHSPNVNVHFLDGKNSDVVRCCWAAADLFLSLVDNPQETFGLAPVEAMAAGLPVVVSDWDGYRYTVSDGVEGFRIPTLMPSKAQQGEELVYSMISAISYQDYVGAVAQHVAVDTEAAAVAIVRLAESPSLGQQHGRCWAHNSESAFRLVGGGPVSTISSTPSCRRCVKFADKSSYLTSQHPLRSDPFRDFASFASSCLELDTVLCLLCLCLSCSLGSISLALIAVMSNSMPAGRYLQKLLAPPE